MHLAVDKLPTDLLERAKKVKSSKAEEEMYSWPIAVIPEVIAAAQKLDLFNIGGHPYLWSPQHDYHLLIYSSNVIIDTVKSVSLSLPWPECVALSAKEARAALETLQGSDLLMARIRRSLKEGPKPYSIELTDAEINQALRFTWKVIDEPEAQRLAARSVVIGFPNSKAPP